MEELMHLARINIASTGFVVTVDLLPRPTSASPSPPP
jgi:hypothetical protein